MKDYDESSQEEMILPEFVEFAQIIQSAGVRKKIALVAHDNKKQDLIEWARYNRDLLVQHDLYATGTTGRLLGETLDTPVTCLQSGPLGGDLQIGSRITEGDIDLLVFFWDPLSPHPHDPDVKALLRIAVVWNIPVACDRATADYVISSPLMTEPYERLQPDYASHSERLVLGRPELALMIDG
jgi:methylglyoxal synthase